MAAVTIADGHIRLDNEPLFLCGAEIHYYRLPRDTWRDRMTAARDAGVNTVASYMPWYFHEPEEGRVDLHGETLPERDLQGFLELAAELGLNVIARPGPFVNSELRYGGFPEWLFRDHPETISRRADGQPVTGRVAPAEGEPLFRDYVRGWFRQVVPLIARFQSTRDGSVILFQPDNELSAGWTYGLLNSLYDPAMLHERWPAWLQQRYGDIDALNQRYGTALPEIAAVQPLRRFPTTTGERLLCHDWLDFKRWFFADWGATMVAWAQEDGIEVPICFNEPVAGFYGHGDHSGFGAVMQERGIVGTTACHTYSDRIMDLEGLQNTAWGLELVKASGWGAVPLSIELNVNWYIPRLARSNLNWSPLLRGGLGHGLAGGVVYPYAAAISPLQDTIDGPEYYEPSCLDLSGRLTSGGESVERFFRFAHAWRRELAAAPCAAECTIAFSAGQRYQDFLGAGRPGGVAFDAEPALSMQTGGGSHEWLDGVENVTRQAVPAEAGIWHRTRESALLCSRLNFGWNARDLRHPNQPAGTGTLIVPNTGAMEAEAITWILEHLEANGNCIFFPTIPARTLDGRPDTRLVERLGVHLIQQIAPAGGRVLDYGSRSVQTPVGDVGLPDWLWGHEFANGAEALVTYRDSALAAMLSPRVLLAGFNMQYTSHGSLRLWHHLLVQCLGLQPACQVDGVFRHALLRRGPVSFLTLIDVGGDSGPSTIRLADGHAFDICLQPHEARVLLLDADLGGNRLAWTTSELTPLSDSRDAYLLTGAPCTPGQLAFRDPVRLDLGGRIIDSHPVGDLHVVDYEHTIDPLRAAHC